VAVASIDKTCFVSKDPNFQPKLASHPSAHFVGQSVEHRFCCIRMDFEETKQHNDGDDSVGILSFSFAHSSIGKEVEELKDSGHHDEKSRGGRSYCLPTSSESDNALSGVLIGSTSFLDVIACPCCQQTLHDEHQTIAAPKSIASLRQRSLFTMAEDDMVEEDDTTGALGEVMNYNVKSVVVEGWLHKKGTGNDWLGSRSWKPRWVRLVTAESKGFDCVVPLLQIFWHYSAPMASSVIVLHQTVVLAVDAEDKDQWNAHRFEIRKVVSPDTSGTFVARSFSCPRQERDMWVYAISKALLAYEKERKGVRDSIPRVTPNAIERPKSPILDDIWAGSENQRSTKRHDIIPPTSPRTTPSNLPKGPQSPPTSPRSPHSSVKAALVLPLQQ